MEDFANDLEQPLSQGFEQECNICRESCSSLPSFRKHMLSHSGDHRAECRVCFARFKEETDLGTHIKSKHIVARASDANDNFYDGHLSQVLANVFDDTRPIELKCVRCGIDPFKSWSDFQNHSLLHVSIPTVRVEKLEAAVVQKYKPSPLKLTLRVAAPAKKAVRKLEKSWKFEVVQNDLGGDIAMNGVTDDTQAAPNQVAEDVVTPQNGDDMFSEVNKALAMLNSSAANEIESDLKQEEEDITDDTSRYAATDSAVDPQTNGYTDSGRVTDRASPHEVPQPESETYPVENENSYGDSFSNEEQYGNVSEEFVNNTNTYGDRSEEYGNNTEVYTDIADGSTGGSSGYGNDPEGYGDAPVGYGNGPDEYANNADEYGNNSEAWVGNSQSANDFQNSCSDSPIVPTPNSNVLSLVTNETEFISLNNYSTENSTISASPPPVASAGDPLNTGAPSYSDPGIAESSFSGLTFCCHVCSESFTAQALLEEHLAVHGAVALKCPICSEDLSSPAEFLQHQEQQHPDSVPQPQQLVVPHPQQSPSQLTPHSPVENGPSSQSPPLPSPQQNSVAGVSPVLQSPHLSPSQPVPSPSQPVASPRQPLSSPSQPLPSPSQLLASPGGPPSVGNTSLTPPIPPSSTATPPTCQLASPSQPMVTIPAPDGSPSAAPRLPPPLYRAPAGASVPASNVPAAPISVGPLGRSPQPGPSGMPVQYYGPRPPYSSIRGQNTQQMGMGMRMPGQFSNQAPILAQSLQRPTMGTGGQKMPMHPGIQSRNVPSLPGNQQRGAHTGAMQNMRGISPQKRVGAPMPMGQSPNKQQRYGDLGIPARQKDTDCQIIAVQQRSEGLPVIQNVQGAPNNDSVPRTAAGGPDSTIHLTDSITLSVRSTPEKEKPPPQDKNRSDANAVANLLATRGITVTPAANTGKEASPQKSSSSHLQPPSHTSQRIRTSQPPPPTTQTLNLNSSISIIPAGNSGQSTSQSVQITPVSSRHGISGRSSHGSSSSRVAERPPRPPTVDLTQDINPRQSMVGMSGGRMTTASMAQHRGMPLQNRGWAHPQIPGRHVCQICDKSFTTVDALRSHLVFHQNPSNRLPYTCSLCNAAYPNIHSLQQHRQQYHNEAVNTVAEMVIPIVDLKQPGIRAQLHSIGIQSFIPLNQLQNSAGGYFGIPVLTMDTLRSGGAHNLKHLGASSILSLGPMKMLPR